VEIDGQRVSSTAIRNALADGDVERAAGMLGRVHDVDGAVVQGDRRGRTLGFPTANLAIDDVLAPADGIYGVVVRRLDRESALVWGAASLGVRPQFDAGRSFEVFLLDFDEDIYGARLRVGFVARIRGEKKFSGVDALVARMHRDVEECRAVLGAADRELWRWI
jgi:riboflavin kinase / FMN adenylyltransferase